jgi:hypothetical protein
MACALPDTHFKGPLILPIDRECTCACEDFVMPFKATHRAELRGRQVEGLNAARWYAPWTTPGGRQSKTRLLQESGPRP